jgi:hypothetical protein
MAKKKMPERRIIVTIDISAQPLNTARLPFTREIPRSGGQPRNLSDLELERNMARLAERYRDEVAQQAAEHALSWSYSSERTSKRQVTRIASGDTDLLIIAQPTRASPPPTPRVLLLDADRPGVLQALDAVLETAAYEDVEILVHGEFDAAALNEVLNAYPGTTRRLMGAPSLDELLTNPSYRPSLVLMARDAAPAELDPCLRLAACPVVLAA